MDDISAAYNIPSTDIEVEHIKVSLDLNKPLRPQISSIVDWIPFEAGEDIYVILPESADATVMRVDYIPGLTRSTGLGNGSFRRKKQG